MEPNTFDPNKMLEYLKKNSNIIPKFCDNCGHQFHDEDINLVGTRNNTLMCRTHCENCGSMHMLNVSAPVGGVGMASRAPINVDISTNDEFNKFAGKAAVSSDDTIDSFKSLADINTINDFLAATKSE